MPYFDHAATTKIHPKALAEMTKAMECFYGNPSSLHNIGIQARKAMNQTKGELAELLGCHKRQLILTSTGTEATNLVIQGVHQKHPSKRLITSTVEHHATLNTMKHLKAKGADVIFVPTDQEGRLDLEALKEALSKDTALLSLIYANNEIGTIHDIAPILELTQKTNTLVHLDMVQVPLHAPINFNQLGVDFITISAHKFHGPRGIALIIARDLEDFERIIHGGRQEFQKRSGTENLAGLMGMKVALEEVYKNHKDDQDHAKTLSAYFIEQLEKRKLPYTLNGPKLNSLRMPHILNIGFKDIDAQWLSFELNQRDIYVSLGSACDSDNIEPSHVLKGIDVDPHYINGSLRFSIGLDNTKKDIDKTVDAIEEILNDA